MLREWILAAKKKKPENLENPSWFDITIRSTSGTKKVFRVQSLPPILSYEGALFLPTQAMGNTYEEVSPIALADINSEAIADIEADAAIDQIKAMTEAEFKQFKSELDAARRK